MATKFSTLQNNYKYNVAASALLFSNLHNKAIRVEVPDLGKEFSDNPEGTLYYNNLDSFDTSRKNVNYTVLKVDQGAGAAPLINIKFYHQTAEECHAEFLAEDPRRRHEHGTATLSMAAGEISTSAAAPR
ncbi:hypothetical protein B0H14DRAFT_2583575 [Mycena olivaceomarginata]|nr:hypothetical protein B0H14DRAFT_2583575 [Mycena olivaceomarginata]